WRSSASITALNGLSVRKTARTGRLALSPRIRCVTCSMPRSSEAWLRFPEEAEALVASPAKSAHTARRWRMLICRGRSRTGQAQFWRHAPHRLDHKCNVLVEIHSQIVRSLNNILAIYSSGECFVLHLLPHGLRLEARQALVGPNQHSSRDQPGQ